MIAHTTIGSIFDDLGFDASEAENLKICASLMQAVEQYISAHKLTQATAARLMGVSQPRISDLMTGKIDKFTIDMLVNMLAKARMSVTLVINDQLAA